VHVVVVVKCVGAVAADDVDGAGGVDHGRVPLSRSPSRAGRAASPRDTCGRRARARPVAPNRNHARAAADARRRPSYKYRKSPPCDGSAHAAARRTHTPFATHTCAKTQSDGNARTHAHALTKARVHARTRAHARSMHARTQMNTHTNADAHCTHTHILAHILAQSRARAPKKPVQDPAHPQYPLVPPRCPLVPLGNPERTPLSTRVLPLEYP
jgi:hypothetical protein